MRHGRLLPKGVKATHYLFILYVMLYGLLLLLSTNILAATARWIRPLAGLSILIVLTALKPNRKQTWTVLCGFMVGQFGLVVVSLYDYFWIGRYTRLHLSGLGQAIIGPNATGMLIGGGLVIALFLYYLSKNTVERVVFGAIAFLSSLALLLTVTRGAIIAALVPMTFLILSRSVRSLKGVIAGMLIVILALIGVYLAEEETEGYLSLRFDRAREGTWSSRKTIWGSALDEFSKSPIIGAGPGAALEKVGIATHNELIGVLLETGILGILLFVGWHASLFRSILGIRQSLFRDGKIAFFLYVVLTGLSIRYRLTFVYFLFAIALEGWSDARVRAGPSPRRHPMRFPQRNDATRLEAWGRNREDRV